MVTLLFYFEQEYDIMFMLGWISFEQKIIKPKIKITLCLAECGRLIKINIKFSYIVVLVSYHFGTVSHI
jgi:hypothetical protein